jgi:hypothetical protein
MTDIKPTDFPKLESPYKRENEEGEYIVQPEIQSGYEWVFSDTDNVKAVEKLHGSNVSIIVEDGQVKEAWTRIGEETINKVHPYSPQHERIAEGIAKAQKKGWLDGYEDGQHFGEIIGEKFHNNPYDINGHLFVPFDYLRDKVYFKSYGKYPTDFESIRDWFQELTPLFYSRVHDLSFDEAEEDGFIEGIVFTHEDGRMAKLRRNMFKFYEGRRHKQ